MPFITPDSAALVPSTNSHISPNGHNRTAFLDTIPSSEIGAALLAVSDNGYNVIVGSTAEHPILFHSYAQHPDELEQLRPGLASTAAGRYQELYRYWIVYQHELGLPDFSPLSQDRVALQQLHERHALELIDQGLITQAIHAVSNIWASFPGPGNRYNQWTAKIEDLLAAYTAAGGVLIA